MVLFYQFSHPTPRVKAKVNQFIGKTTTAVTLGKSRNYPLLDPPPLPLSVFFPFPIRSPESIATAAAAKGLLCVVTHRGLRIRFQFWPKFPRFLIVFSPSRSRNHLEDHGLRRDELGWSNKWIFYPCLPFVCGACFRFTFFWFSRSESARTKIVWAQKQKFAWSLLSFS